MYELESQLSSSNKDSLVVWVESDCTYHILIHSVKCLASLLLNVSLYTAGRPLILYSIVPQSSQAQPSSARPISMHDYVSVSIMKQECTSEKQRGQNLPQNHLVERVLFPSYILISNNPFVICFLDFVLTLTMSFLAKA